MNSEDPKILSDHERDSFRGQTIDEDGTVHDQKSLYEERLRQEQEARRQHSGIHIVTSGLSWRVKLALGFIVFCIVAVIIGAWASSSWPCPTSWASSSSTASTASSAPCCIDEGSREVL